MNGYLETSEQTEDLNGHVAIGSRAKSTLWKGTTLFQPQMPQNHGALPDDALVISKNITYSVLPQDASTLTFTL